jgi:hypothetical protein
MKRILIILALAAIHFALSFAFFLLSFAGGMSRFDAAREPSILERVVNGIAYLLLFPLVQLAVRSGGGWMTGTLGYVPFILNSLLWAMAIYFGVKFLARPRTSSSS